MAANRHPAIAAVNEAVGRAAEGDLEGALRLFDQVEERFASDPACEARAAVAASGVNKGQALYSLQRFAEAMATFDQVVEGYGDDPDSWVRVEVAEALSSKATVLAEGALVSEAVAGFDELWERYGQDLADDMRARVAAALGTKLAVLADQRPQAAPTAAAELASRFGTDREPAIVNLVVTQLSSCGQALATKGSLHEALAVFSEIVTLVAGREDVIGRSFAVEAHYNRAIALRDNGRSKEALAEFDAALDEVGDGREPQLRSRLTQVLYNKGIVLLDDDQLEAAVATFDEVVHRVGDERDDLEIRQWVGRSLVNKGRALVRLQRLDDAIEAWKEVEQRCSESDNAWLDEMVEYANGAGNALAGMRVRAHHVLDHPYQESMTAMYEQWVATGIDPETGVRVPAETVEEDVASWHKTIESVDAFAGEVHDAAAAILWDCQDRGLPFAVFLRNFDLEAYVARDRKGRVLLLGGQSPSEVEQRLLARLAPRLPLLGIANPSHFLLNPQGRAYDEVMPRLEIPKEAWRDVLRQLLTVAPLILISVRHLSAGVGTELDEIRKARKEESTVLILSSADDDPVSEGVGASLGLEPKHIKELLPSDRTLRSFPHVVAEEAIPWPKLSRVSTPDEVIAAIAEVELPL